MARQQRNQLLNLLFAAEKQVGVVFLEGAQAGLWVPGHAGLRFTRAPRGRRSAAMPVSPCATPWPRASPPKSPPSWDPAPAAPLSPHNRLPRAACPANKNALGNLPVPHSLNVPKSLYQSPSGTSGSCDSIPPIRIDPLRRSAALWRARADATTFLSAAAPTESWACFNGPGSMSGIHRPSDPADPDRHWQDFPSVA